MIIGVCRNSKGRPLFWWAKDFSAKSREELIEIFRKLKIMVIIADTLTPKDRLNFYNEELVVIDEYLENPFYKLKKGWKIDYELRKSV